MSRNANYIDNTILATITYNIVYDNHFVTRSVKVYTLGNSIV